ncbi:MAG TPA: hypothetical protein DCZ95_13335 [Verrucomicrobia bacterium]|nr:MAG: hypothetical protein A2X46_11195 [Lentisphaerae bacterium GWF2_57_35]HBA85069.1 hypothetical protein [Verrucomicrobiota bacterium]
MKSFIRWMAIGIVVWGWGTMTPAAQLGRSVPEVVDNVRAGGGEGRISGNPATGLQLALFAPVQIFPANYDVYGFRLNLLYGLNQNLRGLDLGVFNDIEGLVEGLQLGVVGNRAQSLSGVQIGLYNSIGGSENGCLQLGIFNQADDVMGCQLGPVNFARQANGAQIGLINICDTMTGVQVGLINIISQSSFLVFCPIVNAQF